MRTRRLKGDGSSNFYHCVSRVTGGAFLFQTDGPGSLEAEHFVELMHRLAAFCGISILTYAVLANHFHLLCEVPTRRELSDPELLARIQALYGRERRRAVQAVLAGDGPGGPLAAQALRAAYLARMFDVSVFLKELKGRFAQGYNRRHDRYGALWAERFKSILVEGGAALSAVALYIDLNPVRAGRCTDPKDYRYCGYGEAVGSGRHRAREGLARALGYPPEPVRWADVGAEYRRLLFRTGTVASKPAQAAFDVAQARRVVDQEQGALPWGERLRTRLRFFTYGLVLGSQRYVESQMARFGRSASGGSAKAGASLNRFDQAEIADASPVLWVWHRGRSVSVASTGRRRTAVHRPCHRFFFGVLNGNRFAASNGF